MSKSLRLEQIKSLVKDKVCVVTFVKRSDPNAKRRRMLCTASNSFLNSFRAKMTFNFKKPMGSLPYNANSKKLVTVFDLVEMGWRHLNADHGLILEKDFSPENDSKEFWEWFEKEMFPLSSSDKLKWMGK